MASIKASVSYKKKDGFLTISQDVKYLFWTPTTPPGSSPAVTVPVAEITNLQQTPASSPKIALKVVLKDDNHVFSFTHKQNARQEQEIVTDTLRNAIAAAKAAPTPQPVTTPAPGTPAQNGDGGQPAALAMAKAANAKAADDGWYDDNKLKYDFELQGSLLKVDHALNARFRQAREDKPESVSVAQFNTQFWSSRLHLLRAHAIEKQQKMGEYNVLPEIRFTFKPGDKDGDPDIKMLNITKEQIKLIFKQYPLVREAYNENVPKPLRDVEFWTRFFNSRLLKQLKGERINQQVDPPDSILDRYLDRAASGPASIAHIPHFIDLEGNEQNHSQRKGNRPDWTMRPSASSSVPVLQILNNLSEKMLSHVAAEDGEAHAPIGIDEETFEQLRLRDLAMDDVDNRVVLNVREQQRILASDRQDNASKELALYAKQDPTQVLSSLRADLRPSQKAAGLDKAIGFDPDSDSEEDEEPLPKDAPKPSLKPPSHVGSKSGLTAASTSILSSIAQQRASSSLDPHNLSGLSQETFATLATTQNTTTEFLHYFWTLFLSGDASRSTELTQLVSTLDKSLDRINAVGDTAEAERENVVKGIKKRMAEQEKRTGKKARYDFDALAGGRKVVEGMIRPTVGALAVATAAYRKAFEEQTREANAAAAAAAGG